MSVTREAGVKKTKVVKKKPAAPSTAFGPLGAQPFAGAQKQAAAKTQRARRKAEANVVVPYVPKLKNPTVKQRAAAAPIVARSLNRQGVRSRQEIRALPKEQRDRVERAAGYQKTLTRQRVAELLAQGYTSNRDTVKAGDLHKRLHLPGATIDLTPIASELGGRLHGNPLAAFVSGTNKLTSYASEHGGAAGRSLKTAVDLPANTVTTTYKLGKDVVTGHPDRAASALYEGAKQTLEHPLHDPLATVLVFRGVKGAAGSGAGSVMRAGALGKTAKRAAGTERAARQLPDGAMARTHRRQYSRDPSAKAVQVVVEKGQARLSKSKAGRKLGVRDPNEMRAGDIKRAVNEDVQAAKTISGQNVAAKTHEAQQAIGVPTTVRGKVKARVRRHSRPTAATNLAAQGIVSTSKADLQAYLAEIRAQAPHLRADEIPKNLETQRLIEKAIKTHDPAAVQRAAAAFADLSRELEHQVVTHNLVSATKAEEARLVGSAVRRLNVSAESKRAATADAKAARAQARTPVREARRTVKAAEKNLAKAKTKASRVSGVQSVQQGRQAMTRLQVAAGQPTRARGVLAYIDEAASNPAALAKGAAAEGRRGKVRAKATRRLAAAKQNVRVARGQLAGANAAAREARAAHVTLKKSPWADAHGRPVSVDDVRAVTAGEPAFVSHQPINPRSAAIPVDAPRVPVKEQRTGEAVRKGTLDVSPAKLVEQVGGTQRLIDAAKARAQFLDNYGFRDREGLRTFGTGKVAEEWARKYDIAGKTGQPWRAMKREDGQHVLVPEVARKQLAEFEKTVDAQHPVMRAAGTQWRRNVLAFSPRWLTGNTLEAAVRSLVAGAGPVSHVTARRVLRKADAETRQALLARTASSGNYSAALRAVEERQAIAGRDLGRVARALHALGRQPGPKQLGGLYEAYTNFVFRTLNGNLESQFRIGMLGKALRQHPVMSQRVVNLSGKAAEEAARGLKNTNVQAELGRLVDDMYGKYDKFSPGLQGAIANYTPFIAWTLNATNFLYHVLPRDHPVLVGVMASASKATEQWRKQHGLYLDFLGQTEGQVPPWLQGSIPGEGGSHLRVSRYTPFGLLAQDGGTPLGGVQSLLLPQLSEITANLKGEDWQGKPLSENPSGARDLIAAAATFLEGQVPLAAQVAHVAGVKTPNMRDGTRITPRLGERVREQFDPFRYTPGKKPSGRVVRKSDGAGLDWSGGAGGIEWSDGGVGVDWGS